ncbi:hypothetical protein chiPu_0014604 [Chiloscyllium punctatum]|uniref:Uncharacterized protein n=1 Tax=Chiloscyllium punctatum TaxID=137246 RepID=A0A401T0D0_CHIPU|nr:hypothetical protein [Chiloscyllium punctatum]
MEVGILETIVSNYCSKPEKISPSPHISLSVLLVSPALSGFDAGVSIGAGFSASAAVGDTARAAFTASVPTSDGSASARARARASVDVNILQTERSFPLLPSVIQMKDDVNVLHSLSQLLKALASV